MRNLVAGTALFVSLAAGTGLMAQSPEEKYEKDAVISTGRRLVTPADIVHQRAVREAQEREARIESRHWQGVSLQRPVIYAGPSAGIEFLSATPWRGPVCCRSAYWDWTP